MTTGHNLEKRQDGDKTLKRARARNAEGTIAYWRAKLFKNTYRDRQGQTIEQPEWYVRLRHDGETRRVRLHTSDKDKAAEEAVRLSARLAEEGWLAVRRGMARLPASPTIEDFCAAYERACEGMERPPRPISRALYCQRLRQVCRLASVSQLRDLTPAAVDRARDAYLAQRRAQQRKGQSVANSLAGIIRNAAACFSREARRQLAKQGLTIEANPFDGHEKGQYIEPVTSLPLGTVNRVWKELPILRDGDPDAEAPTAKGSRSKGRPPIDWRKPHPKAWAAILLALGAGLRANEADKARWRWFRFDSEGNCFLEIQEEDDFTPKGGVKRTIRVPRELYDELVKARKDMASPYVLGGPASANVEKKGFGYRRPEAFRVATAWLRARGVEEGKRRGNPLHRLRKEFGSQVATTYGLFAAQKLLGHTSPALTSRYYASLTDLPELTHLRIVS